MRSTAPLFAALVAVGLFVDLGGAAADPRDPAGWSVATDPRKRAFLVATERAGGPRLLTLGCLRDVDTITVIAGGFAKTPAEGAAAALSLRSAGGVWRLEGRIETDGESGAPVFSADLDVDAAARKALAARFAALFGATGPLTLALDGGGSRDLPLAASGGAAAVAGPYAGFAKVCFGR